MRTEQLGSLRARITGGTDGDGGGDGPVVVLMHGFGAPGDDLVPLWRALDVPRATRFVFPEAPLAVPIAAAGDARAWWMIDLARLERARTHGPPRVETDEVPAGLAPARAQLCELLDALEPRFG